MKKVLSLALTVIFVISICAPVFAEADKCDCGFSPLIYVGPLGCSDIVRDAGTDVEQRLWKTDTGFILENLKKVLPNLLKGIALKKYDVIGDALVEFVNETFGDLALDSDGNSYPNVTTPNLNVPTDGNHGPEYSFYFDYDFRLDPYTHADRLNTVINQIKQLTGHDKVQLKASSMGGVVLSAYLDKYGYSSVEKIICQCCPLWGTAVAGELFCGKFELNATSLRQYAQGALPYMDGGDFLQGILYALTDVLRMTGAWEGLISLGDKIVDHLLDRVYDEVLIPIFGSLPGIWSFVPAEYYEDAVKFMKIDTGSGLYAQIDHYRTAQNNVASNLKNARDAGVRVYLFCGYNVQRTPLVTAWHNTSDGTVDTKYASLGATCAYLGETLPDSYLNTLDTRDYLSPDGMIDASTCELRDCTWFNRDWLHCNGQSAIDKFYKTLLASDEQLTVFSLEEYPQFLQNDDHAETLKPVAGPVNAKERLSDSFTFLNLIRFLSTFVDWFCKLLNL